MKQLSIIIITLFCISNQIFAETEGAPSTYTNQKIHSVVDLRTPEFTQSPKNVILLIGDGMAVPQVTAALTANKGQLNIGHMKHIGLMTTQSANNYLTDSGAAGTAIATGQRVNNRFISMNADMEPIPTILQIFSENGKATGIVVTCAITHATPAVFYAHQPSRNMLEEIALDLLNTDIDVVIGGGMENFNKRDDGRDLTDDLRNKGYQVFTSLKQAESAQTTPIAILTNEGHPERFDGRGNMLEKSTAKAIKLLDKDKNGFFMMIEGAQIDWAGHANDAEYIVGEMLDFDRTIGIVLEYAASNGETLVIVTSDHETGGMSLLGGSFEEGTVTAKFTTGGHSGEMVPVFAYGPGAEQFIGIYQNVDIFHKIKELLNY